MSQYMQSLNSVNYRHLSTDKALIEILKRQENRQRFLSLLTKFVYICTKLNIRMIFENPITDSFLNHYFLKSPDVKDMNRMKRGDFFNKPTGYWFWNMTPTYGESYQNDKVHKTINKSKASGQAGLCSEDRSMISSDYARNFICDFILGKVQDNGQQSFDFGE